MGTRNRYSAEVRERAVRMVLAQEGEHALRWPAIQSIAGKIACSAEALRNLVKQAEIDAGQRDGLSTDEKMRMKELERENKELRRGNDILRKASADIAQAELDRRPN